MEGTLPVTVELYDAEAVPGLIELFLIGLEAAELLIPIKLFNLFEVLLKSLLPDESDSTDFLNEMGSRLRTPSCGLVKFSGLEDSPGLGFVKAEPKLKLSKGISRVVSVSGAIKNIVQKIK